MLSDEEIESIKGFLEGEFSLDELLEGDETLSDHLNISGLVSIYSKPEDDFYEFLTTWEDKEYGITDSEVKAYIRAMDNRGFKVFIRNNVIEDEWLTCRRCGAEIHSGEVSEKERSELLEKMTCSRCGGALRIEAVYEHVDLEDEMKMIIPKMEVHEIIKASRSVDDLVDKWHTKLFSPARPGPST